MIEQLDLIRKYDWDILIVLDALRNDVDIPCLKKYHRQTVNVDSTWTLEWLQKTWEKYYNDILYISGNPYCNSKGPISECMRQSYRCSFSGRNHFKKVYDAWETCFNEELNTINAQKLSNLAISVGAVNKEKKMIVHFLQPHRPYVAIKDEKKYKPRTKDGTNFSDEEMMNQYNKVVSNGDTWFFNDPLYKAHKNILFDVYKLNIVYVAPYVLAIIKYFKNKKIIVTSDHGEAFGEDGRWQHGGPSHPILNHVPWIVIE